MFSFDAPGVSHTWQWTAIGCLALIVMHALEARYLQSKSAIWALRRINNPFTHGLMFGLCLWLVLLPSYDANPFIYFRF